METISSLHNPAVKYFKGLKLRKKREESGEFFIEGKKLVFEAISSGIRLNKVLITENCIHSLDSDKLKLLKEFSQSVFTVTDNVISSVSEDKNPQGIIASLAINDVIREKFGSGSFCVILDGVQDPGNMGTIIRTAYAAGVDCIYVISGCVDIFNTKVIRAAMGAVFHVPIVMFDSIEEAINELKNAGFTVFASHLSAENSTFDTDFRLPCAIVIGSEGHGISKKAEDMSDCLVKIPMPGAAESLNASVAAALLIYEVVRKNNL